MKYLFVFALFLAATTSLLMAAKEKTEAKGHEHGGEEEKGHEHGGEEEKGHEHGGEEEKGHEHGGEEEKGHEHGGEEEKGHKEGDDHGHEEGAPRFGPDKGVTDANEKIGFKLNDHAYNNFKIELLNLSGSGTWQVPKSAIVYSREETHVYRFKDGYFKSLDIKILGKGNETVTISSPDLKSGDQVAAKGTGFLLIVDQAIFGEELAHEH